MVTVVHRGVYAMDEYVDDYEGDLSLEDAGYLDEVAEDNDSFDKEYERLFGDGQMEESAYERDAVTGRKAKRPRMSVLNKSKLSKHELDELFLD